MNNPRMQRVEQAVDIFPVIKSLFIAEVRHVNEIKLG